MSSLDTTLSTKRPWRLGRPGTVVADDDTGLTLGGATGPENVRYYGGNLICESISEANAAVVVLTANAYDEDQETIKALTEVIRVAAMDLTALMTPGSPLQKTRNDLHAAFMKQERKRPNGLMREVLDTVAAGYDSVRPGAGDCVRELRDEKYPETETARVCTTCKPGAKCYVDCVVCNDIDQRGDDCIHKGEQLA